MSIWNKTKARYEKNTKIDPAEAARQLEELSIRLEQMAQEQECADISEWLDDDNEPFYDQRGDLLGMDGASSGTSSPMIF